MSQVTSQHRLKSCAHLLILSQDCLSSDKVSNAILSLFRRPSALALVNCCCVGLASNVPQGVLCHMQAVSKRTSRSCRHCSSRASCGSMSRRTWYTTRSTASQQAISSCSRPTARSVWQTCRAALHTVAGAALRPAPRRLQLRSTWQPCSMWDAPNQHQPNSRARTPPKPSVCTNQSPCPPWST